MSYGTTATRTAHECCPECGRQYDLEFNGIRFDGDMMFYDDHSIHLTEQESAMMQMFARALGRFIHKEAIYAAIWPDYEVNPKIIDVRICYLRKKLRGFGLEFECVWGRGYKLIQIVERKAQCQSTST